MSQKTDQQLTETYISSKRVFDGIIVHVDHAQYQLPNGAIKAREIAVHPGASAIVVLDDERRVTLVKQYRCPLNRLTLEIPAGKLDHIGEDRLEAAKRELREETGLTAARWTHLTDMATTPGFCSEVISLYLAEELTQGDSHPDEDEFIDSISLPLNEACQMVLSGKIQDSKTALALLMTKQIVESR